MITIRELREASGRQITLNWDMSNPNQYAADWQDQGVNLDNWNKSKGQIVISGNEKNLYDWLVNEFGLPKKDAHLEIMRGKKVKL
jgi:hypothetical protein